MSIQIRPHNSGFHLPETSPEPREAMLGIFPSMSLYLIIELNISLPDFRQALLYGQGKAHTQLCREKNGSVKPKYAEGS
jgi:hypothetical protein